MSLTVNHNIEAPLQNGSILTTGLTVTHTINAVTEGGGSVDTVNGVEPDINKNIQLSYNDLDDLPTIPDQLSDLSDDETHRTVTDTEKSTWNNKQDALGFIAEDVSNKSTDTSLGTSDSLYPSQKAVKTYVDNHTSVVDFTSDQNIIAVQMFS